MTCALGTNLEAAHQHQLHDLLLASTELLQTSKHRNVSGSCSSSVEAISRSRSCRRRKRGGSHIAMSPLPSYETWFDITASHDITTFCDMMVPRKALPWATHLLVSLMNPTWETSGFGRHLTWQLTTHWSAQPSPFHFWGFICKKWTPSVSNWIQQPCMSPIQYSIHHSLHWTMLTSQLLLLLF